MRVVILSLVVSLLVGNANTALANSPYVDHEVFTETAQVVNDDEPEVPYRGKRRR
jgi:hypothetical protein